MSKKSSNPFHNNAFNKKKPVEKGKPMKEDPFLEEELDEEIEDIEALEMEQRTAGSHDVRALERELHEAKDKLLRAHAEIDNVRRRAVQDVEKAHKYGIDKFVKELLPVVDSLDKALELGFEGAKALHEGVELTHNLLMRALAAHGVAEVNPVDQPFDPNLHEAMSMQAGTGAKPNTVVMVFQKGYQLNGRLIRPALVVVAQ